jgi:hypothetical protein
MSHTPSRWKLLEEERRAREIQQRAEIEEQAKAAVRGRRLVALWNARASRRRPPQFYPTIYTAIVAGYPLLNYMCPGCQQCGRRDLRYADRHPAASISSLIPSLSCRRCSPNPPFAVLLTLDAVEYKESDYPEWFHALYRRRV